MEEGANFMAKEESTTPKHKEKKTMQAIPFFEALKTGETLKVVPWPMPDPLTENEVLIEVRAFGINFAGLISTLVLLLTYAKDIVARKGQYQDAPPFPFIPGYEVSGVVVEVGSKVQGVRVGERVLALSPFGGYAEYVKTPQEAVVTIPESWSFAQAAAIPVSYVTAYFAVKCSGMLFPGDRVLIHACAGGLGLACLQLALHNKCEVYGTCGSEEKVKFIKEKGVHHAINYSTTDFEAEIKRLTNGEGVDLIIDSIGGTYFKKDLNILRPYGRVVGCGAATASDRSGLKSLALIPQVISMVTHNSIDMMLGSKGFIGLNMKRIADKKPQLVSKMCREVIRLIEDGDIKPDKPAEYNWTEIAKVHHLLENRKTTGKIVMIIPTETI